MSPNQPPQRSSPWIGYEEFQIGFVQDWNRFLFNHNTECLTYPAAYISAQPWSFLPQNIVAHLEEISQSCVSLSTLVDIFVGVQTSADQIYIIHADREDENFIYSHDRQGCEFQIEKGILRKSIYDTQLVSYEKIEANSYIIFPYKAVNGRPVLYSLAEMTEDFPHALAYLNRFKYKLDERNMPGRTTENWFAFGRSQSLYNIFVVLFSCQVNYITQKRICPACGLQILLCRVGAFFHAPFYWQGDEQRDQFPPNTLFALGQFRAVPAQQ